MINRNGWGASIVDALSTAILMDDADVVIKALEHIETIDFSKTDSDVSVFETTVCTLAHSQAEMSII